MALHGPTHRRSRCGFTALARARSRGACPSCKRVQAPRQPGGQVGLAGSLASAARSGALSPGRGHRRRRRHSWVHDVRIAAERFVISVLLGRFKQVKGAMLLLQHSCVKMVDKAAYRQPAAKSLARVMALLPPADRTAMLQWVQKYSRNGKTGCAGGRPPAQPPAVRGQSGGELTRCPPRRQVPHLRDRAGRRVH